jgi:hypothetical protein
VRGQLRKQLGLRVGIFFLLLCLLGGKNMKCLLLAVLCVACYADSEITIGNVRVQALSPILLRIEPKGPQGFEDR